MSVLYTRASERGQNCRQGRTVASRCGNVDGLNPVVVLVISALADKDGTIPDLAGPISLKHLTTVRRRRRVLAVAFLIRLMTLVAGVIDGKRALDVRDCNSSKYLRTRDAASKAILSRGCSRRAPLLRGFDC